MAQRINRSNKDTASAKKRAPKKNRAAAAKKKTPKKASPRPKSAPNATVSPKPAATKPKTDRARRGLTAAQKRNLQAILESERHRIITLLNGFDNKAIGAESDSIERGRSGYSLHEADAASDAQTLNLTLMQRQIEASRLEAIESALRRMGSKDFGKCRLCQCAIDYERLKALPYADYCVTCRAELEAAGGGD